MWKSTAGINTPTHTNRVRIAAPSSFHLCGSLSLHVLTYFPPITLSLLPKEKVTEKKEGKNYNLTLMLLRRTASGWMFPFTAEQ